MARFLVKDRFEVRGRVFALCGDLVDGTIRAGMFVHMPMNSGPSVTARISAVELARSTAGTDVCLCFPVDGEVKGFLADLRIAVDGPQMVEVTESGQE